MATVAGFGVRLAPRVRAHIRLDPVPEGVHLVAGMTAPIEIEPGTAPDRGLNKPESDAAPPP